MKDKSINNPTQRQTRLIIRDRIYFIFIGAGESAAQILYHISLKADQAKLISICVLLYDNEIKGNSSDQYAAQAILKALDDEIVKIKFIKLENINPDINDILKSLKKLTSKKRKRSLYDKIDSKPLFEHYIYKKSYRIIKEKNILSEGDWCRLIKKIKKWERYHYDDPDDDYKLLSSPSEYKKRKLFSLDKLYWNKILNNYGKFKSLEIKLMKIIGKDKYLHIKDREIIIFKNKDGIFNNDKIFEKIVGRFTNKQIVISPCNSSDGYGVVSTRTTKLNDLKSALKFSNSQASRYRLNPYGYIVSEFKNFCIEAYVFLLLEKNELRLSDPIFFKKTKIPTLDEIFTNNKIIDRNEYSSIDFNSFAAHPLRSLYYFSLNEPSFNELRETIHKKCVKLFHRVHKYNPHHRFLGLKFGIKKNFIHKNGIVLLSVKSTPCDVGILSGISHMECQTTLYLNHLMINRKQKLQVDLRPGAFEDYDLFSSYTKYKIKRIKVIKGRNYFGFPIIDRKNLWNDLNDYSKIWKHLNKIYLQNKFKMPNQISSENLDQKNIPEKYRSLVYTPYNNLLLLYYKPEDIRRRGGGPQRIYGHFAILENEDTEKNINKLFDKELERINSNLNNPNFKLNKINDSIKLIDEKKFYNNAINDILKKYVLEKYKEIKESRELELIKEKLGY